VPPPPPNDSTSLMLEGTLALLLEIMIVCFSTLFFVCIYACYQEDKKRYLEKMKRFDELAAKAKKPDEPATKADCNNNPKELSKPKEKKEERNTNADHINSTSPLQKT
jgi:hypothetical protein